MSLGKKYIGQDISPIHINESQKIIEFIYLHANELPKMCNRPIMNVQDIITSTGEYPCLFTCPPYGDKEIWKYDICDTKSCDDWIDICLGQFNCDRYLFVVDSTERYKDYIVDEIVNKSHFGRNSEYVIMINKS